MTNDLDTIQAALEEAERMAIGDAILRMRQALTLVKTLRDGGWQDISTAPKDGTEILMAEFDRMDGVFKLTVGFFNKHRPPEYYGSEWEASEYGAFDHMPTHWMPLPPQPLIPQPPASGGDDE